MRWCRLVLAVVDATSLIKLTCRAAIHEAMEQQSTHVAKAGMMVRSQRNGETACERRTWAHGLLLNACRLPELSRVQCIACRCPCTHAALCLQRATQVATKGALGWLGLAEG